MLLLLFTYDSTLFLCASFPPSTSAPPGISLPSHQMTGRPSSSSSTSPGPHLPPRVEWVCSCRQGEDIQCNAKVQIWDKILKHFILKKPSTLERSSYTNNSLETAQAEPRSAVFYLDIFHHSETLTRDIWLFFIRLSILSMESSPWRKIESRKKLVNLNTKRNITNRQKLDINDMCLWTLHVLVLFEAAATCNHQPELPAAPPEQDRCVSLASFKLAGYCCQQESVCVCLCAYSYLVSEVCAGRVYSPERGLPRETPNFIPGRKKEKPHTHFEDLWETCMFTK